MIFCGERPFGGGEWTWQTSTASPTACRITISRCPRNDFCRKIAPKSTGKKPDERLSEFRNPYFHRIAVTIVDMIVTVTVRAQAKA